MTQKKRTTVSYVIGAFYAACYILLSAPAAWGAKAGIASTVHNLSVSGPGELKALTETRICVFCHTPHNAAPQTPLWNKNIDPVSYDIYASTTLHVSPSQPTGSSRLCLSCHDGTIALGNVRTPSGGIQTTGEITSGRLSYIGTSLTNDHPISFSYYDATVNHEIAPSPPAGLLFFGPRYLVQCSTCHDAHEDAYRSPDKSGRLTGKFLVMNNRYSALCTQCHIKDGWLSATHRSTAQPVNAVLPLSPRLWPTWLSVTEWGCESCHTPHSAGGNQRLLNFQEEEKNCLLCHNGTVAQKNIQAQFQKLSHHPVETATIGLTGNAHQPNESPLLLSGHVECADCHNAHAANNRTASAPYASGRLELVSGVSITGAAVSPVTYEYEVCFKCHADSSGGFPLVSRVVNMTNTRFEFDTANPSYHPVAGVGRNTFVPSIPSTYKPTLTASSIIYCKDCHESDESTDIGGAGPRGPHGSQYRPLLRERYETLDNTFESFQNYALCYRCHNRDSILGDQSFKEHREHIVEKNTPCSVCHDPHGVRSDGGLTGDHTHLINFDTRVVSPVQGRTYPTFTDLGTGRGSCTLVCHGKTHNPLSY
ncbi:MAG: cytochrome c3 family protein [Nitrospirota bacterium]